MPDPEDVARIETYRPTIPDRAWADIGPFVKAIVAECVNHTSYSAADLMYAVTRHVWWCTDTAGFELDRTTLFRRDVIAVSVEALNGVSIGAKGNRRSQLFRVAEALLTIERPVPIPAFRSASAHAPYAPSEVVSLRGWANGQPTVLGRSNAWALLVLGLGAGLRAGEICAVSQKHIIHSGQGRTVIVSGSCPRTVPLLATWEDDWNKFLQENSSDDRLFRPGVQGHYPNMVTNFVHRSSGVGLKPQTQRLRSTWIVTHLTGGTPLQPLMAAAGVTSFEAFSRLVQFLPTPDDEGGSNALRHPARESCRHQRARAPE